MLLQWDLTSIPGPFPACPEISKTSLQPFTVMQSSQVNSSFCVMLHIRDGEEYRITCMYQILCKNGENGYQNLRNDENLGYLSLSTNA
jgi:hypothetical protein